VHPVQVAQWKRQALDELPHLFTDRRAREVRAVEEEKSRLYEQVARLKVELEWLKKTRQCRVSSGGDGLTGSMLL